MPVGFQLDAARHRLSRLTRMPVILPAKLDLPRGSECVLVKIGQADEWHYEVSVENGESCGSANACTMMSLRVDRGQPTELEPDGMVDIGPGWRAAYRTERCGGSCSPPRIWWREEGLNVSLSSWVRDLDIVGGLTRLASSMRRETYSMVLPVALDGVVLRDAPSRDAPVSQLLYAGDEVLVAEPAHGAWLHVLRFSCCGSSCDYGALGWVNASAIGFPDQFALLESCRHQHVEFEFGDVLTTLEIANDCRFVSTHELCIDCGETRCDDGSVAVSGRCAGSGRLSARGDFVKALDGGRVPIYLRLRSNGKLETVRWTDD